jgi:hypothetical protein
MKAPDHAQTIQMGTVSSRYHLDGAGGVWGLAWRQATTLDPVKINIVIVAENFQAPMETNPEITF